MHQKVVHELGQEPGETWAVFTRSVAERKTTDGAQLFHGGEFFKMFLSRVEAVNHHFSCMLQGPTAFKVMSENFTAAWGLSTSCYAGTFKMAPSFYLFIYILFTCVLSAITQFQLFQGHSHPPHGTKLFSFRGTWLTETSMFNCRQQQTKSLETDAVHLELALKTENCHICGTWDWFY